MKATNHPRQQELPTSQDDPRLRGWYHTIELGNGLHSIGTLDLRQTVDLHLPQSLAGKTALDVATCNGFWAFEMEARGAEVTAIDVETWADSDLLPWVKAARGAASKKPTSQSFELARAMRGSSVEHKICSVYDLSPDIGMFDFVFCGSLLMHLQHPLKALVNIRSVTKENAVVATLHSAVLERDTPDQPALIFGHRWPDLQSKLSMLGAECVYWHMNTRGLQELMEYAGFARTEPMGLAPLTPLEGTNCVVVAGYTAA